ncbi:MAG: cache domain-containing protein [Methanospirillum sp.]
MRQRSRTSATGQGPSPRGTFTSTPSTTTGLRWHCHTSPSGGTNFWNETDSTGQHYTQVECELARKGGGFVYYDFPNPAHGMAVEPKMRYVQKVDGSYWIGAGTYLPVAGTTPAR